jgi:uncharacterized membrane protein YfcA
MTTRFWSFLFVGVFGVQLAAGQAVVGETCHPQNQIDDCELLTCIAVNGSSYSCQECSSTEQCMVGDMTGALYRACLEKTGPTLAHEPDMECRTKPLFGPFYWQDGVATLFAFTGGVLAAGAGIGGGGIMVPLFILFGWGRSAVIRSLGATTGIAVAMIIMIAPLRHPLDPSNPARDAEDKAVDRPLIDYDVALLVQPIILLGAVPGKLLNKIFPSLLIYVLLLVLLVALSKKTWSKYFLYVKRAKEKAESRMQTDDNKPTSDIELTLAGVKKDGDGQDNDKALQKKASDKELADLLQRESKQPWCTIIILVFCWLCLVGLATGVKYLTVCGSSAYWIVTAAYIPGMGVFTLFAGRKLHTQYLKKEELGYQYAEGDLMYTTVNVLKWPTWFLISGLLASLLGIGGGMVIGPLLLEMNMDPAVANGTTALMTLFTASAATFLHTINDLSSLDYFFWYFFVALASALLGRIVLQAYLKRTGKQTVVVLLLAVAITISVVLMTIITVMKIAGDVEKGVKFEFLSVC